MPFQDEKLLRQIPLFTLLDDDELHSLALQLDERNYLKGQVIFNAGERGGAMYIVQSGQVEIFLNDTDGDRITLGFVSPGDLFGEFSLLDNEPRSASAQAVDNTTLVVVDQNDLSLLVQSHPAAALDMMAMLTRRIRESNTRVQERSIRNVNQEEQEALTIGQRVADGFAATIGSWRFIIIQSVILVTWMTLNVVAWINHWDPYPFILLNLVLSFQAAYSGPIIMMSQNRTAARDRIRNDIEYEVNLRAEVEVRALANQVNDLEQVMLGHLSDIKSLQTAKRTRKAPKKFD